MRHPPGTICTDVPQDRSFMTQPIQLIEVGGFAPAPARHRAVTSARVSGGPVRVVLVSTYELGRQPFGVASASAWLRRAGAEVACIDLAVEHLGEDLIAAAGMIAFYVPMHTATRIAATTVERVKALNPAAHLCFFGLYAPVNERYLRSLGAKTILGGEFESGLVALVTRLATDPDGYEQDRQREPVISVERQEFLVPDRQGMPEPGRYAFLTLPDGERRAVGSTEASRGCKHLCRHCPVVPVYGGRFRIVPRDVVLEDIRRQVVAGAEHITFGDPDFFNGIGHAIPLVEALHREFPDLTYDVTIKIEHLLRHAEHIATLKATGCLFVTTAVESVDDTILEYFDKRHTREDFLQVVTLFRQAGLALCPTFVTFTPWTTPTGYRDLLSHLAELDLIDSVPPIQLAIRLLISAGSRLLELPDVASLIQEFDEAALYYPWTHPDPRMDRLHRDVLAVVEAGQGQQATRREIFARVWALTHQAMGKDIPPLPAPAQDLPRVPIPYLSEPWFC
jgi:radical SAM superfamily enzyme YgiQ (UPF0313 family)